MSHAGTSRSSSRRTPYRSTWSACSHSPGSTGLEPTYWTPRLCPGLRVLSGILVPTGDGLRVIFVRTLICGPGRRLAKDGPWSSCHGEAEPGCSCSADGVRACSRDQNMWMGASLWPCRIPLAALCSVRGSRGSSPQMRSNKELCVPTSRGIGPSEVAPMLPLLLTVCLVQEMTTTMGALPDEQGQEWAGCQSRLRLTHTHTHGWYLLYIHTCIHTWLVSPWQPTLQDSGPLPPPHPHAHPPLSI